MTGATNLMTYYGLEHSYSKFSGKKLKESLSSFLPNLPGMIDTPGDQDNSSLRSVIDKPPIGGKELLPLTSVQLSGFRLHPGPVSTFFCSFQNNTNCCIIIFLISSCRNSIDTLIKCHRRSIKINTKSINTSPAKLLWVKKLR